MVVEDLPQDLDGVSKEGRRHLHQAEGNGCPEMGGIAVLQVLVRVVGANKEGHLLPRVENGSREVGGTVPQRQVAPQALAGVEDHLAGDNGKRVVGATVPQQQVALPVVGGNKGGRLLPRVENGKRVVEDMVPQRPVPVPGGVSKLVVNQLHRLDGKAEVVVGKDAEVACQVSLEV